MPSLDDSEYETTERCRALDDDEESEEVECDDDCGDDGLGASRVGEAGSMLTELEGSERGAGLCAAAKMASIGEGGGMGKSDAEGKSEDMSPE